VSFSCVAQQQCWIPVNVRRAAAMLDSCPQVGVTNAASFLIWVVLTVDRDPGAGLQSCARQSVPTWVVLPQAGSHEFSEACFSRSLAFAACLWLVPCTRLGEGVNSKSIESTLPPLLPAIRRWLRALFGWLFTIRCCWLGSCRPCATALSHPHCAAHPIPMTPMPQTQCWIPIHKLACPMRQAFPLGWYSLRNSRLF
jgi:hypothetical protein